MFYVCSRLAVCACGCCMKTDITLTTNVPRCIHSQKLTYLIHSSYTLRCRGCFFILIILHRVGLLGRMMGSSQGLYLNTGQHKQRINTYTYHTSMPCVGFEPMIPDSERAKTVHALGRSATVIGPQKLKWVKNFSYFYVNYKNNILKILCDFKYFFYLDRLGSLAYSYSELILKLWIL
jgi:hypothetical protein